MSDTITATIELPKFIDTPDGRREVERVEYRYAHNGEYRACYGNWLIWSRPKDTPFMHHVAILKPIVEYYTPTPVEACRLLADAGGPIECWVNGGKVPVKLIAAATRTRFGAPFLVDEPNVCYWVSTIRVRKP